MTASLDSREFCMTPAEPGRAPRRTALAPAARRPPLGDHRTEFALDTPPKGKPLRLKIAESRKALIGGIGAVIAAVVPLSPFLPASGAHVIAAVAAVLTGFATYLAKNATPAAVEEPSAQGVAKSPQTVPSQPPVGPAARHTAPVLAGLALIVGGAVLAGRHSERHRRCVTPFLLLPPSAGR